MFVDEKAFGEEPERNHSKVQSNVEPLWRYGETAWLLGFFANSIFFAVVGGSAYISQQYMLAGVTLTASVFCFECTLVTIAWMIAVLRKHTVA